MTTQFEPRVRAFLEAPDRYGVLATIDADGRPLQAVVWYLVQGDSLLVNSLDGRLWPANLRRDPRFSMMVEDGVDYVALRGKAEVLDDPEQAQEDIAAMARRYRSPGDAERMIKDRFRPQLRVSFRLRPSVVTAHWGID